MAEKEKSIPIWHTNEPFHNIILTAKRTESSITCKLENFWIIILRAENKLHSWRPNYDLSYIKDSTKSPQNGYESDEEKRQKTRKKWPEKYLAGPSTSLASPL